jgi:hypothetical protein
LKGNGAIPTVGLKIDNGKFLVRWPQVIQSVKKPPLVMSYLIKDKDKG